MSCVFLTPQTFTVVSANQQASAPASNMQNDIPGFVWRSVGLSDVYVTVQLDGKEWDSIALVNCNLTPGATIRVRAGSTASAVAGSTGLTIDQTFPVITGIAPAGDTQAFKLLVNSVIGPFVRIDISNPGNPANWFQAQRLVIAKRITTDGVNSDAEQGFEDTSAIEDGLGYTSIDRYAVKTSWKVTLDGITDAQYQSGWYPFFKAVGRSRGFLFIPDDASPYVQNQAMFCRITSSPKGTSPVEDYNIVELNMLSVS